MTETATVENVRVLPVDVHNQTLVSHVHPPNWAAENRQHNSPVPNASGSNPETRRRIQSHAADTVC